MLIGSSKLLPSPVWFQLKIIMVWYICVPPVVTPLLASTKMSHLDSYTCKIPYALVGVILGYCGRTIDARIGKQCRAHLQQLRSPPLLFLLDGKRILTTTRSESGTQMQAKIGSEPRICNIIQMLIGGSKSQHWAQQLAAWDYMPQ
jgi:hypothetical protein